MTKRRKDEEPDRTPDEGPEEMITRSFRLPRDLMEWLDGEAEKRRRKTNNYLEFLLARIKARRDNDRAG